jgi:hypothetical protein
MNINGTSTEEACKFLLQKNISFEINNKIFKHGKIILFYQKNFYITFIINTSKKERDKIEIPIPFDVEIHPEDGLIFFDYRIKTLAKYAPDIETNLIVYPKKITGNKFWDSILLINANFYLEKIQKNLLKLNTKEIL